MNIEEHLIKYEIFFRKLIIDSGFYKVTMAFPKNFLIIKPVKQIIKIEGDGQDEKNKEFVKYLLSVPLNEGNIDDIFLYIDELISYNETLKEKKEIFKEKIKDLEKIFIENDIEDLRNLEIKINKVKRKSKKQIASISKKEEISSPQKEDNIIKGKDIDNLIL